MIKHSGKIYALIIATGKETKIMLNSGSYKLKKSNMEFSLNILVVFNIFILLCLDAIMCGLNYRFIMNNAEDMIYIWSPSSIKTNGLRATASKATVKLIASYYLLFN